MLYLAENDDLCDRDCENCEHDACIQKCAGFCAICERSDYGLPCLKGVSNGK